MNNQYIIILVFICTLGSGLVAGVFFAFSTFVMSALGRLAPEQGISAMQAINVTVLNPWFFGVFFGTASGCLLLSMFAFWNWGAPGALYLVTGSFLYLGGTILVTMSFNVPLNNALAVVEAHSAEGARLWPAYQSRWTGCRSRCRSWRPACRWSPRPPPSFRRRRW